MKKFFITMAAAVAAVFCLSGCSGEYFDTLVEWGFADDENSEISTGLEQMIASAGVIFDAFDHAFYSQHEELGTYHQAMMKHQKGKKEAIKNAKATADLAHSMIEEGHVCPVEKLFVVRIKYNSDKYETVWSHDYTK